jgi:hypothetical protein
LTTVEDAMNLHGLTAIVLISGIVTGVSAQTFTRKPFLQKGSYNKASVCWRVSPATSLTVKYGIDSANLSMTSAASAATADACVALDSTTLQPSTKYFYQVFNGATQLTGATRQHFRTAPPRGNVIGKRKMTFWILGDPGANPGDAPGAQRNVRDAFRRVNGGSPDGILMNGDIAYESGTDAEFTSNLFTPYQDDFATTFVWSSIGNHEAVASTTGASFLASFDFPRAGEIGGTTPSNSELYYSFDYGNIHFIILDSQISGRTTTGTQYLWLQQDLQATRQDWIVAIWHHPPYSKSGHDSDTEQRLVDMRQNFLPLLEQYGVDLVYNGHSHDYERTYLIDSAYGNAANNNTNRLKVVKDGTSGNPETTGPYRKPSMKGAHQGAVYALVGSSAKLDPGTLHPMVYRQLVDVFGSAILTVEDTVLTHKFIDSAGVVRDQFQIVKTRSTSGIRGQAAMNGAADQKFTQVGRRFTFAQDNASSFRIYTASGALISEDVPRGIWDLSETTYATGTYYFRYGKQFGKLLIP